MGGACGARELAGAAAGVPARGRRMQQARAPAHKAHAHQRASGHARGAQAARGARAWDAPCAAGRSWEAALRAF
jgi:hypothetical protein